MLVIIGHGPSIVNYGLGPWIDQQTVVRLKEGPRPNEQDWGTRIDYQCASTPLWLHLGAPVWVLPNTKELGKYHSSATVSVSDGRWWDYFHGFGPNYKMSTGLRAIFCASEFLRPSEIALVGFDNLLNPHTRGFRKWKGENLCYHDWHAEHEAAFGIGMKLFDARDLKDTHV